MGGKGSGTSRKRKTLPRQFRPGALLKADQRRREIRAAASRLHAIHSDQGGVSEMPATLQSLAERYVFCEAKLMELESAALEGTPLDVARYVSLATVYVRLADRLGYQRRQRRVTLADYIAANSDQKPAPAAGEGRPV